MTDREGAGKQREPPSSCDFIVPVEREQPCRAFGSPRRSRRATLLLQAGNEVVDNSRMPMPRDAVGELWGIAQQAAESGPVRIPSQRIVYDTRSSCLPSFLDHDTRSPRSRVLLRHTVGAVVFG